jgi:type VI secretion system protein ImpG
MIDNHYFNTALKSLKDALRGYAKLHATENHLLNLSALQDHDPTIERLLEGFAYISGELHRIVDDDIPEISETLLMQLAPDILAPIPSETVIQFLPKLPALQKPICVPQGFTVCSDAVGEKNSKVICRFTTQRDCTINPLTLTNVIATTDSTNYYNIKLILRTTKIEDLDLHQLPFYLYGDYRTVCQLYELLTHQVKTIEITHNNQSPQTNNQLIFKSQLFSDPDQTIFKKIKRFFACPEQQFFITLEGLQKIDFPKTCKQFEINIKTHQCPHEEMHLNPETFQLNCVPAINIYQSHAEPIFLENKAYEYPLHLNLDNPDSIQLHSIKKIESVQHLTGKRYEYFPLHQALGKTGIPLYQVIKRYDKFGKQQIHLNFNNQITHTEETISCLVNVTNGDYPRQYLSEGTLLTNNPDIPHTVSCKNITRPSRYFTQPQQKHLLWYLISHLTLNLSSLCQIDQLKRLLTNCDFTSKNENKDKIESILNIETQMKHHIHQGIQYSLLVLTITIDEKIFSDSSEIYIFGEMLQTLFSELIQINMLLNQKVICKPSLKTLTWFPIIGQKKCL